MGRYLVVANQTLGGDQLMAEVRRRTGAGPSSFYVIVPNTRLSSSATTEDEHRATLSTCAIPTTATSFAELVGWNKSIRRACSSGDGRHRQQWRRISPLAVRSCC